jgi:hypothetical protein
MTELLYKLKPGVPRQVLLFIAAVIWGFAAYKLLRISVTLLANTRHHFWYSVSVGLIGSIIFYRFVFSRVTTRYINRIRRLPIERPCLFAFFDLRGYALMIFMITCGILFRRFVPVPDAYVAAFYGMIGLSLMISSMRYLVAGFQPIAT